MNEILVETHKQANIDFLKVRDFYFDKARNLNRIKSLLEAVPVALLVLFIFILGNDERMIAYGENVIAAVSFAVILISRILLSLIGKYKSKSDLLREIYDINVLKISPNEFLCQAEDACELLRKAYTVKDMDKYQVWYSEVFCASHPQNVLCAQMDNVIYSKYIYRDAYRYNIIQFILLITAIIVFLMLSFRTTSFFIVVIPFVELLNSKFDNIITAKEQHSSNNQLYKHMSDPACIDEINAVFQSTQTCRSDLLLRKLQDAVFINRQNSMFIPKWIRMKHLIKDSTYNRELSIIRDSYMVSGTVSIPEHACDIGILSHDEKTLVSLQLVQERLREMLFAVLDVFDQYGIPYFLDGGTLIGAIRNNVSGVKADRRQKTNDGSGGFLFWDDDVDLVIPYTELPKVKKALTEKLGTKVCLQDAMSDRFYSPRLSTLRIREAGGRSIVGEKDSSLWPLYENNGLFIDLYTYSPVMFSRFLDKMVRRCFIHPLHRRLAKTETSYQHSNDKDAVCRKFIRLKRKYLKRIQTYVKYARNTAFYAYTPFYIENSAAAGPYFTAESIFGQKKTWKFEGRDCSIVSDPVAVLDRIYGASWYKSPFSSKEDLQDVHGPMWFSYAASSLTVLKHIRHLDIPDPSDKI